MKRKSQSSKKNQSKCSLFAVLLNFSSEFGMCDLRPVQRSIESMGSKLPFNKLRCVEYRGLSREEADELQVNLPAMTFRVSRSTTPWVAYLERYRDPRKIEHCVLRVIDGRERAEQRSPRWKSGRRGTDPIRFLCEKDLPQRRD